MNKPSVRYGIWSWRRWVQFRLRGALLLIVLCSIAFAWVRHRLDSYRKQHETFASISRHAVFVSTLAGTPNWLKPFADAAMFSDIGHLSFHLQRRFSDLEPISHLPRLYRLSLHGTAVTDDGLRHLSKLHELDTLSLKSTQITDQGLRHLAGLQKLRMLQLSDAKVTRGSVEVLAELRSLEVLELSHVSLEDDDIRRLGNLSRLHKLEFCPGKLTLQGFAYLSAIKSLQELRFYPPLPPRMELHALPELSDASLYTNQDAQPFYLSLTDLPKLSRFDLEAPRIDDLVVRNLPRIRHLVLHSRRINERVFQQLIHLRELGSLSLVRSRFDAAALRHFAHLPRLASLNLCETGIKDEDLQYVSGIKSLDRLDLSRNSITGRGLVHLVSLPHLKSLNVSGSKIGRSTVVRSGKSRISIKSPDSAEALSRSIVFQHLSQLRTLEELILGDFAATKDELLLLGNLANLKDLQVDTRGLDDDEFAEVSQAIPGLAPTRAFVQEGWGVWRLNRY